MQSFEETSPIESCPSRPLRARLRYRWTKSNIWWWKPWGEDNLNLCPSFLQRLTSPLVHSIDIVWASSKDRSIKYRQRPRSHGFNPACSLDSRSKLWKASWMNGQPGWSRWVNTLMPMGAVISWYSEVFCGALHTAVKSPTRITKLRGGLTCAVDCAHINTKITFCEDVFGTSQFTINLYCLVFLYCCFTYQGSKGSKSTIETACYCVIYLVSLVPRQV